MKIAFIVGSFPTLSETFILNQITGLIDRGHDVFIFSGSAKEEGKTHPDVEKYNLINKTYYFPRDRFLRIIKAPFVIIKSFSKAPQITLKALNIFKYRREAFSLKLLYLTAYFVDKDFEIIYCHFGPNGIIGTCLKDIGMKGKVVTTFHAYDLTKYVGKNGKNVYRFLFKKGDLFLSISNYWIKRIVGLGGNPEKIIIHRMGIDIKKFNFIEKKLKRGEKIRILTVGRLVEKKGHKYIIEAIKRLSEKYTNIEYIVAGNGPLLSDLKRLVKKLNIEKYVNFLGAVNQKDVIELYYNSHIFALASITAKNGDQEGIPVVLMEASATGMPVVSTYHTGIPEVVMNHKSGFLVPEKNVDRIVEKIEYLINHPKKWKEIGREGRKIVEEKYDIEKLNDRLVEIFKKCLNGKQ